VPVASGSTTASESDVELRLTSAEVAAAVGLSEEDARRFWRALGLPDAGEEAGYTEADLAAIAALKAAVENAGLNLGAAVRLARTVGQNVARMSEWQVAAIASRSDGTGRRRDQGESPDLARSRGSFPSPACRDETRRVTLDVADALEQVLVHAWRRHLTAALTRMDTDPDEDAAETFISVTVGFADLVAFSALSNDLDPDRLGELVEIFEARCADAIAASDGRMIKTLGDSVLFYAEHAEDALAIANGIIDVIGRDPRLPDVSLGLASGEVISRLGDVFGPPVNLAARLTALARRNRVLVDEETVTRLTPGRYDVRRLTARPVRGFGLVEPIAVRRVPGR
jgi:adenylate cyclase